MSDFNVLKIKRNKFRLKNAHVTAFNVIFATGKALLHI